MASYLDPTEMRERLNDLMDALNADDKDEAFDAATDISEAIASGDELPTATRNTWANLMDGIIHILSEDV